MRARDIAIVVVCVLASMVAWMQEGSISIMPAFKVHLFDSSTHRYIPPPIVTDLNGDGKPETVLLRLPTTLSVVPTSLTHGRSQMALQLDDSMTKNLYGQCIGLGVGYLSFPEGSDSQKVRKLKKHKQHIAVVTNDYKLQLYDANLTLMWSVSVTENGNSYMVPRVATVLVLPDRIFAHDQGVVVVGVHIMAYGSAPKMVFAAFHGGDGALRWRHTDKTIADDLEEEKEWLEADKFRFTEKDLEENAKSLDWTTFGKSVIAALPHAYSHSWDNRLVPFHMTHNKNRKKRNQGDALSEGTTKQRKKLAYQSHDSVGDLGQRLRGASHRGGNQMPHRPLPNTVVAHTPDGVSVLHLYTGRSVTVLKPLQRDMVYDDINEDGRVESLASFVGVQQGFFSRHGISEEFRCDALVRTDVPTVTDAVMFRVGVCDTEGYFSSLSMLRRFAQGETDPTAPSNVGGHDPLSLIGSRFVGDANTVVARPAVLHVRQQQGRNIFQISSLALYFVSSGQVTAVNAKHRRVEWRVDTEATFEGADAAAAEEVDSEYEVHTPEERDSRLRNYPHVLPYNFHERYRDPADVRNTYWAHRRHDPLAIAFGNERAVLIDSLKGRVVGMVSLPGPPVAPAIIADFNGDGVNDFIVFTKTGYHGYLIQRHVSGSSTALLMFVTIVCIGLLVVAQRWQEYVSSTVDDDDMTSSALPTYIADGERADVLLKRKAKRSTD